MASKLESLVGFLRKPKKGHFYHQNSYKGIDNYLLDCARVSLDNDAMMQEWSIKVADAVNDNADAIAENSEKIATNTENIATNTDNIATNADNIASNTEKIDALQNGRIGTVRINFDYDTNGVEADKIYYVQDEDEGHYSYLDITNSSAFEGFDSVLMEYYLYVVNMCLINAEKIYPNVMFDTGLYDEYRYTCITLLDTAFHRSYDDGSDYVTVGSNSILIIHVLNLAEDVEITLVRKANA